MSLTAAHLNTGVIPVETVAIGIYFPSFPLLTVPNKPYCFCGRLAPCLLTYLELYSTKTQ